jgi:hypothetical protein
MAEASQSGAQIPCNSLNCQDYHRKPLAGLFGSSKQPGQGKSSAGKSGTIIGAASGGPPHSYVKLSLSTYTVYGDCL